MSGDRTALGGFFEIVMCDCRLLHYSGGRWMMLDTNGLVRHVRVIYILDDVKRRKRTVVDLHCVEIAELYTLA